MSWPEFSKNHRFLEIGTMLNGFYFRDVVPKVTFLDSCVCDSINTDLSLV